MDINWFAVVWIFIFGLAFGSFLNVCIYRLPREMSVMSPSRSFCPNCEHQIAGYDNIPVLSWLILRGRCRYCHQKITPRYAVIELFTGLLFVACYFKFGGLTPEAFKACVFCYLILGLIFTDLETRLLPDVMTIPGTMFGVLFAWFVPMNGYLQMNYEFHSAYGSVLRNPRVLSVADSLLAAAVGALALFAIAEAYFRLRGFEGMGFGDVKLMALIGAFLGLRNLIFVMFAASATGALYGFSVLMGIFQKRRERFLKQPSPSKRAWRSASMAMRFIEIPFGVFLGGMSLLALFYGDALVRWYFGLFLHGLSR